MFVFQSLRTFMIFMFSFLQIRHFCICESHEYFIDIGYCTVYGYSHMSGCLFLRVSVTHLFSGHTAAFCATVVGCFVNAVLILPNLFPWINNFNIVLELLTFLLPV